MNNSPTVFGTDVESDENNQNNNSHEQSKDEDLEGLGVQNSDDRDTHSEENSDVTCEDFFEECEELNLNDFLKYVVDDRPYYDIADLAQAQYEQDQYASQSLFCCFFEKVFGKEPWPTTSCRRSQMR